MIIKLSNCNEVEKAKYYKYYNEVLLTGRLGFKFLSPTKDFDENGLKFPVDYLRELGINNIFLPLEIMAQYVDIVTKTAIDTENEYFVQSQFIEYDFDLEKVYNNLNATSIGNLAYVALCSKSQHIRQICMDQLNQIFAKATKELLDQFIKDI